VRRVTRGPPAKHDLESDCCSGDGTALVNSTTFKRGGHRFHARKNEKAVTVGDQRGERRSGGRANRGGIRRNKLRILWKMNYGRDRTSKEGNALCARAIIAN